MAFPDKEGDRRQKTGDRYDNILLAWLFLTKKETEDRRLETEGKKIILRFVHLVS
jgi:hypothetical protein